MTSTLSAGATASAHDDDDGDDGDDGASRRGDGDDDDDDDDAGATRRARDEATRDDAGEGERGGGRRREERARTGRARGDRGDRTRRRATHGEGGGGESRRGGAQGDQGTVSGVFAEEPNAIESPAGRLQGGAEEADETKMLEAQIGKLIDVKLVDHSSKRIVVSERALLQERASEKLPVGDVKEVVVTSLSDFGAFVEVCDGQGEASGLEGLVHISEISWNRISHPRDAVKVGQREFVKVLEVNDETGRINFSIKQTQADPLMETLETIMPVTMPEPSIDEDDLSEIPLPGLPDICSSLLKEDGIEAVIPGRQAMEQRVVSQDLELWLTNVFVEDGYNLLARAGRQVQEIHVVTRLDRDAIKRAIKRATSVAKSQ